MPFVTEVIYQNLVRGADSTAPESVHHGRWPQADLTRIDLKLTTEMALVVRLASLGHAARNQANRKLRQPLAEAAFAVGSAEERAVVEAHAELLADELNVKRVRLLDTASEAVDFTLNPYPRQLGQKHGSRFPALRLAILALDAEAAATGCWPVSRSRWIWRGSAFSSCPTRSKCASRRMPASRRRRMAPMCRAQHGALRRPGTRRPGAGVRAPGPEARKAAGLHVADRIVLVYHAEAETAAAIQAYCEYVQAETLATELSLAATIPDGSIEISFDENTRSGSS